MGLWQICHWLLALALGPKPLALGTTYSICNATRTIIIGTGVHFEIHNNCICMFVVPKLLMLPLGQWTLALGLWLWDIGISPYGMCPLAFGL